MTYQGFIKKSRTYDFAAVVAILAVLQMSLPTVLTAWSVPERWNGLIMLFISVMIAFLRKITTGPVGDKP